MKNDRANYRVLIPQDCEVYFTVGTGYYKYKVLDISEGGLRFLSPREIYPGAPYEVKLHFPSLEEPIPLNLRVARCEQFSEKEINPTEWRVGARFAAMSIGLSDRLYNQILDIKRQQITPVAK